MRNATNIVEGALTRFKEAGFSHDTSVQIILRAGDAALGCSASWPGAQVSEEISLPESEGFMKVAALGLAFAASNSSGRDLITDIFSDDEPAKNSQSGGAVPPDAPVRKQQAKPDPAASLLKAAKGKTAGRQFLTGFESLSYPLMAPRGVPVWQSVLAGAGLGATAGIGLNLADRVMYRNDPDHKNTSIIGDALKFGLGGAAISATSNYFNKAPVNRDKLPSWKKLNPTRTSWGPTTSPTAPDTTIAQEALPRTNWGPTL